MKPQPQPGNSTLTDTPGSPSHRRPSSTPPLSPRAASRASRDAAEAPAPVVGLATACGSLADPVGRRAAVPVLDSSSCLPAPKRPDAPVASDITASHSVSRSEPPESSAAVSPAKRPRLSSLPPAITSSVTARIRRAITQRPTLLKRHDKPPPLPSVGLTMASPSEDEYGPLSVTREYMTSGRALTGSSSPGATRFSAIAPATPELASWSISDDPATPRSSVPPPPILPLRDLSIVELLEQDDRPTFLIDLTDKSNFRPGPLQAVFANCALRAERSLYDSLVVTSLHTPITSRTNKATQDEDFVRFKTWILTLSSSYHRSPSSTPSITPSITPLASSYSTPSLNLAGLRWTCSTLRQRYRVVRGVHCGCASSISSPASVEPLPAAQLSPLAARLPESAVASPTVRIAEPGDYFGDVVMAIGTEHDNTAAVLSAAKAQPSFDWTRLDLANEIPAHIRLARSVDWAATPLGPIELWPTNLRTMANMVMGSPNPTAIYWGAELTAIYNEAYVSLVGENHPRLMGSSGSAMWGEAWPKMHSVFLNAWASGQSVMKYDDRVFVNRSGFLEETFLSWSIVPLVGPDGSVVALFNPVYETTQRKVNERRMQTLNELGEKTSRAQTVPRFWQSVLQGLKENEYDLPFVLLYSTASNSEDEDSEVSSLHSGCVCNAPGNAANGVSVSSSHLVLEGSLGVLPNHPLAPASLDLQGESEGFAPYMRQCMPTTPATGLATDAASPAPVVLSVADGTLPANLLSRLQGQRGFGGDCHTVVVIPVCYPTAPTATTNNAAVAGFVIMGTNPRRPYNHDYKLFIQVLAQQLTTSLSSAVLFEEETRRAERAARRAVHDRQELSQQLRLRTQQMLESENKFMRMAESTPVGLFVADERGRFTYCNDMWWKMSQIPRRTTIGEADPASFLPGVNDASSWSWWMGSVHDEDRPDLEAMWTRMVQDKTPVTYEFRFRNPASIHTPLWVLLRAYPEKDAGTGELKSIFGCIMDISQQKLAEAFEIRRRQEAVEHKRQQENFIDITSHEMRNPLSAILQSVDEITGSISTFRAASDAGHSVDGKTVDDLLEGVLEAVSTISLCSNHQKRIIEDVLTLSKLDSKLLLVRPMDVQPVYVLRSTLKMFEAEFYAHDIRCTLRMQPSYQALIGADGWVKLDPSRLAQVLINLMTNAVRFTQASETRTITISVGASMSGEPGSQPGTVDVVDETDAVGGPGELSYIARRTVDGELGIEEPEWGTGTRLNLHLAVADSGKGLSQEEMAMLFEHYSHKLPRTHVQYGGPGLGLFISRNLAELQGGQIGVKSRKGHGSVFALYVRCRQTVNPNGSDECAGFTGPTEIPSTSLTAYSVTGSEAAETGLVLPAALRHYQPTRTASFPSLVAARTAAARTVVDDETTVATQDMDVAPAAASMPPFSKNLPALDVLIVEDNIVNQRVLQRQLDKCGNRTRVANHGEEALDALRQSRFWRPSSDGQSGANISIILMDLEMPVMDGMTCARAIRDLERAGTLVCHVPIIAVTAYARPEQIESAKEAGVDDVIAKPFRLAQLMPKILELVAKYQTV